MRRIKTLASLVAALFFALALGGYAYAHALNFESDLSEDGVVNVCNPDNVRPGMVKNTMKQWNALSANWSTPTLREVTGNNNAFCEVTVARQGSPQSNFYAQVVFGAHPDQLQISPRFFTELSPDTQRVTITHEFGHIIGLDHPPANVKLCAESVMTTITECDAVGVERRSTPGPHDEADLLDYWVAEQRIYPVKNKCWDSACSKWGPPASTFGASSRDGSGGGGGRKVGAGDSSSGVQVRGTIRD